jgi:hypothetical protein
MTFADSRVQRAIASLLLVCMVPLAFGIPLPGSIFRVQSAPFPCQHSACGCASAERCWNSCCCNTDEQKLAWAKANNVQPPAFLVRKVAAATVKSQVSAKDSAGHAKRSCCANRSTNVAGSSCESSESDVAISTGKASCKTSDDAVSQTGRFRMLIGAAMNRCQGVEHAIKVLSETVVKCDRPSVTNVTPPFLYSLGQFDDIVESLAASIDPPIP